MMEKETRTRTKREKLLVSEFDRGKNEKVREKLMTNRGSALIVYI